MMHLNECVQFSEPREDALEAEERIRSIGDGWRDTEAGRTLLAHLWYSL